MARIVPALALVLVVAGPAIVQAVSLFDFDWTSFAEFSTLIPVNRVEPDGSVTPFDEVRISGTRNGLGVLALTRPPELDGGFFFEFSGIGGGGAGQTLADGTILPGQIGFPLPPDVPVGTGPAGFAGGALTFVGSPSSASALSISYFEGTSPHCLVDCFAIEFSGTGRRRAVSAPEPSGALLVAIGLVVAVAAGTRRRRGRAS
jgi:hypothetical protein